MKEKEIRTENKKKNTEKPNKTLKNHKQKTTEEERKNLQEKAMRRQQLTKKMRAFVPNGARGQTK